MKQEVSKSDFIREFREYGRQDQFTQQGLCALYDYLEQYEEDCGTPIELDVIALCCEYTEYEDLEELQNNYAGVESMKRLEDNTTVIMIDDESFIIADY